VLLAGVVGRAHGLDGSFYVNAPRIDLLDIGCELSVAGSQVTVVRRAGTDSRPIIRIASCTDRAAADVLRGTQLLAQAVAPPLGDDEYRAEDLEGARVRDGDHDVGVVRELIALPSCECLTVARTDGSPDLLVPLVRDAIRAVDIAAGVIDVDLRFLGEEGSPR
jgi:16S rRNA processing protein RimM